MSIPNLPANSSLPFSLKRLSGACAVALGLSIISSANAMLPIIVSETFDDGTGVVEGSFSWALAQAASSTGASTIVVGTEMDIDLMDSLVYDGTGRLEIYGSGQNLRAMGDFTIFEASQGATISINGLSFEGPGGFDINNQSTADNPGKGIFVKVPIDATGTVTLELVDVTVSNVANHGIHVSDCSLADACGSGGGGGGDGSAASIRLLFDNVTVDGAGNGKFDADGVRADERGTGSIIAKFTDSTFMGVGADGVELDEGNDGSVIARVSHTSFTMNGAYCDPVQLGDELDSFLDGADDEGEFEDADGMTVAMLPGGGEASGFSDNGCIEYAIDQYPSGNVEAYELGIDVDDGFDIDEAGEGSLRSVMVDSQITDNFDEGVDYDEEDGGSIVASFVNTVASGNTDDGYKMSEEGDGAVLGQMYDAVASGNGGAGAVFEEADGGSVIVTVEASETFDNDGGDGPGLEVVQEDTGGGSATLINSSFADGTEIEGVELIE